MLGSSRLNCAWELGPELLSLLACKLITVLACARRYGYVIVYGVDVCGGDFSKVLHCTLTLFWEKRGVVFKHLCQRQTGCSFLYVSRHYCSSPRTHAICAGELLIKFFQALSPFFCRGGAWVRGYARTHYSWKTFLLMRLTAEL